MFNLNIGWTFGLVWWLKLKKKPHGDTQIVVWSHLSQNTQCLYRFWFVFLHHFRIIIFLCRQKSKLFDVRPLLINIYAQKIMQIASTSSLNIQCLHLLNTMAGWLSLVSVIRQFSFNFVHFLSLRLKARNSFN